ncbi:hypothetical protein [Paenibacillus oleatilyticus]|uniref:Uncharacterized protein n=1 Tax=Paenibacillus oleatilyticus TaxID=2594886 RepID=A0ABV4V6N6_9BACL
MSITSKIVETIREQVDYYEQYSSIAEGQQNLVDGYKAAKIKKVHEQLRLAEYETKAQGYKDFARTLYNNFKDDFDDDELTEVKELIKKL